MVARTPPKQQRRMAVAPPLLSPTLLRETVKKVDKCMARLQELQYAVNGGKKMVSGVSLSPRSTRGYLRSSVRCKQESLRTKNVNSRRSPPGKLPVITEEWQRMSLPAMLLGETMGEILQASQFARAIVEAVSSNTQKPTMDDPKTPGTETKKQQKPTMETSGLRARRKREKQVVLKEIRSESEMPSFQRAKSKINFKVSSPTQSRECNKENCRYIANRVSPRNRPWVRKTVLFPNPLFHSSPNSQHQKFCKTKSPMIARNQQKPYKFLVKSPPASKFQVKIRSPPISVLAKKSPEASTAAKLRRSFSPSRLANRLVSPLKGRKSSVTNNEGVKIGTKQQRRSFSPSRLAERLMSPLKSRKSSEGMERIVSGLKQRPMSFSMRFSSPRRI